MHPSKPPSQSTSPSTGAPPISKNILSALFAAIDKPEGKSPNQNYVFVENDQENHFLYGLVLPLIARLLAVSCPGLMCIVQLPRPDVLPQWILSLSSDGYASNGSNGSNGYNGSNGSKSAAPTTPFPQDSSRTPSPSDEGGATSGRKSISPDSNPGTAELIRHADKVLSGAEAAATKRAAECNMENGGSPPPDSVVQDHLALRLVCNGFEVLTGKMPPPRYSMGPFTLATVGWEKAGVIEPEDSSKAVSMSFSNGMMTPTEGIVVTFSNGSLCLLTLRDPISCLKSLKISDTTPVVFFSFASVGQLSIGDVLTSKDSSCSPVAADIKECCSKPNLFFIEVGHKEGSLPGENEVKSVSNNHQPPLCNLGTVQKSAEERRPNCTNTKTDPENGTPVTYVPIVINSIPRAIPLFVNTINHTFIDPPYYEASENAFEMDGLKEKYQIEKPKHKSSGSDQRNPNCPSPQQNICDTPQTELSNRNGLAACSPNVPITTSRASNEAVHGMDATGVVRPLKKTMSCGMGSSPAPCSDVLGKSRGAIPTPPHGSMYGYYGYGTTPMFPRGAPQPLNCVTSQPITGSQVHMHQGHGLHPNHPGYFVPRHPNTPIPNVHHPYPHPTVSYPAGSTYYGVPMPPSGVVHPTSDGHGHRQWHGGIPPVRHSHPVVPSPGHMDARRDMPIHFSSHRAVSSSADGHYTSPYYVPPSTSGHIYAPHATNGAKNTSIAGSGPLHTGREAKVHNMYSNDHDGTPNHSQYMQSTHCSQAIPVAAVHEGGTGRGPFQIVKEGICVGAEERADKSDGQNSDKEEALEALIGMRSATPQRVLSQHRSTSNMGDKYCTGPNGEERNQSNCAKTIEGRAENEKKFRNEFGAGNIPCEQGGVEHISNDQHTVGHLRQSMKNNSSSSTYSQGRPMITGTETGNSHVTGKQNVLGCEPVQKKHRQM